MAQLLGSRSAKIAYGSVKDLIDRDLKDLSQRFKDFQRIFKEFSKNFNEYFRLRRGLRCSSGVA